ncbi:uncharacterized protein LOC125203291 isoform X2 [Salvia hispanica]|uniref:uncharacterized protein LOC125203291 isoform X2 n=1 Tax=Salvia hispanica TaxID=49212 RepID=UPI002009BDDA|nr:uncharacterized protein LOC125203291 isoform X2 [Salvia hispanica]
MQFRLQLQNTKKDMLPMQEYLNKMKSCCDFLGSAGCKISDEDQILYILGGLAWKKEKLAAWRGHNLHFIWPSKLCRKRTALIPLEEVSTILAEEISNPTEEEEEEEIYMAVEDLFANFVKNQVMELTNAGTDMKLVPYLKFLEEIHSSNNISTRVHRLTWYKLDLNLL